MELETRALPGTVEIRKDGERRQVAGTGIQWNTLSSDLGGFREEFAPGSITIDDETRVVWQHDNRYVFGRKGAGTAVFTVDDTGAHFVADPPNAQWARDAMESIERGDVYQNSFKFSIPEPRKDNQKWEKRDGVMVRTVLKAHIYEMGPQTEPAYPTTTVALRSMEEALKETASEQPAAKVDPGVVEKLDRLMRA